MVKLKRSTFKTIADILESKARPLEVHRFKHRFRNGAEGKVAEQLQHYQNEDGGFGNELEPDFRLPDSSPLATSIAIRYLKNVDSALPAQEILEDAITYLERTFDQDRNGWFAVPKQVNDHPHAWWWHYDEETQMSIIDKNWGNPTAEIIGYMYRYRNFTDLIDTEKLIDDAIDHLRKKEVFKSDNEIYCYIHLYQEIPRDKKQRVEKHISRAVEQLVVYDENKWNEYVPTPVDFVPHPELPNFGIPEEKINDDLDFLVNQL
ncbi:MAG: hypothetical protein ACQESD_06990, partial [Thermoplasmatota archaeon]